MRKDICVYVSSPYSYKDIFDVYYQAYQKFASKSSIPLVLSTNYDAKYEGIHIITSGDINDSWVSRSLDALKQIESKYILLMCDDIFLIDELQDKEIYHIVDVMDKLKVNFCRLIPRKRGYKVPGEGYLIHERKNSAYAKNLQFGIYNREYLLKNLGDGSLSAWDIESKWLNESYLADNQPFKDVICVTVPIIKVVHGVDKGKLFPSTIKTLNHLGIQVNTNREVMPLWREYQQHIRGIVGVLFSPKQRYIVKKVLSRMGMRFTSDY